MRSTHNTIRALAIGIGLTVLVVTATAAMMAVLYSPIPANDVYRTVSATPVVQPARYEGTHHDSLLYERVVTADGRTQWVLTEEPGTSLAALPRRDDFAAADHPPSIYTGAAKTVSYTLVAKPAGLSKTIKSCSSSTYDAYDIACNSLS